jgi:sugar lactone lactonase YvrE
MIRPEIASNYKALLGEGPCWDDRSGMLFWIDILGRKILRYDPVRQTTESYAVSQPIGFIGLCAKQGLICALQDGLYRFNPSGKSFVKLLARPDPEQVNNRFNDGFCDPAGRLFIGTMSNLANEGQGGDNAVGTLFRIDPDLQVKALVRKVTISNGLALSPDQKTLYYIDSPTRAVSAFDYSAETGDIENRRVALDFRSEPGIPDGMTIDADGCLWIAHWGGWKVSCWDPQTGQKIHEIVLPCQNVTCCTFGGQDLDVLYITTGRIGLSPSELLQQPEAGALFAASPGVRGLATGRFRV